MLNFQLGSLETLFAPSQAVGWALMSGGHSDWFLEYCSAPYYVSEPRMVPGTQLAPSEHLLNEMLLTNLERTVFWKWLGHLLMCDLLSGSVPHLYSGSHNDLSSS